MAAGDTTAINVYDHRKKTENLESEQEKMQISCEAAVSKAHVNRSGSLRAYSIEPLNIDRT